MAGSRHALFGLLLAAGLAAQDQKPGSVEGAVVNAFTGAPLARAHVVLRSSAHDALRKYGAITNAGGKFTIRPIESGTYEVGAELPGFLLIRARGESSTLEVKPGDALRDVKLKLTPHGVIAGRVVDANGDPVEHVTVEALSGALVRSEHTTYEKGEFRLAGLPPGKYLVRAKPLHGQGPPEARTDGTKEESDCQTYYPDSPSEQGASPVEARAGSETTGIDIRLARVPVVRVSGAVTGIPAGALDVRVRVSEFMYSHDAKVTDGRFAIWRLPWGRYRLHAIAVDARSRVWASAPQEIDVSDSHIDRLELALLLPFEVAGQVVWDGDPPGGEPHPAALRFEPVRSNDQSPKSRIEAGGAFRIAEVDADRYRVVLEGMPGNVYVKSLRLGPAEMPDRILDVRYGTGGAPLTVTLSTAGAQISGVVQDSKGPLADVPVALVNDAPEGFTLFLNARTGADGSYSFRGLAPGAYRVFVFDSEEAGGLNRSGSLGAYEQAAEKVAVAEGDKVTRDLKL